MHTDAPWPSVQNRRMSTSDDYRRAAVAYLSAVISATGKSASELAALVGASHTTFTRPLKNPDYKFSPKFPKLQKLSEVTGVPLSPELIKTGGEHLVTIRAVKELSVRWIAAAGLWKKQDYAYDRPLGKVPMVEDPTYDGIEQWAELIEGVSMNRHYQSGDFVHVVDIIGLQHQPEPGNHVIAVRRDPTGKMERSCKVFDVVEGRRIIRGDSTDPVWNEPVDVEEDPESTVEIVGLVIGSYRRRPLRG